jgi:hypothetical protein
VTINGTGSLAASGTLSGIIAQNNSTLTIAGGTVAATGGDVGINNVNSTLNITGGTVTATGGSGHGITNNIGGTLNISGGTVTTTGSTNGIYTTGATLNISGGTVTATGGSGAGISNAVTGTTNITGGTVTATGTTGGFANASGGAFNIGSGATVTGSMNGAIKVGDNTPSGDCGLLTGSPGTWSSSYDTPALKVYYSGQTATVTFSYAPTSDDRTVKVKLTDSIADYFTAPETVLLGYGEGTVYVPLTVKQLTADQQGISLSAGAGLVEVQIGSGTKYTKDITGIVPTGTVFYNALDLCNTVTIAYSPATPYYEGNINISVVNGKNYTYRYSLDGGYKWSDAISENSIDITPYDADIILIKAANSYNYIRFDLNGSGLPFVPPGIARKVQIPGTADLGLAVNLGPGDHYVALGSDLTFTVTPSTPIPSGKTLSVQTNPSANNIVVTKNANGTYTVTIEGITKDTKVTFAIVTGNEEVATAGIYSVGNTLYITTAQTTTVQVYNVIGQLVKTVAVSGEATLTLPTGLYLVKSADKVYKISIR